MEAEVPGSFHLRGWSTVIVMLHAAPKFSEFPPSPTSLQLITLFSVFSRRVGCNHTNQLSLWLAGLRPRLCSASLAYGWKTTGGYVDRNGLIDGALLVIFTTYKLLLKHSKIKDFPNGCLIRCVFLLMKLRKVYGKNQTHSILYTPNHHHTLMITKKEIEFSKSS